MGLHALIHQNHGEVKIALQGCFGSSEIEQLRAIVRHFKGRGCDSFTLDFSRVAPMTQRAEASLHRLIGFSNSNLLSFGDRESAIRRLAESPCSPSADRAAGDRSFARL